MRYLLTIAGDNISPRFDMTSEILIAQTDGKNLIDKPRTILLNKTTSEDMCELIIKENTDCLICGGIEERYYKYLQWKKTQVIESIIGSSKEALERAIDRKLSPGAIFKTL